MSFNMDDVNVGGQLKVGSGVYPAIKEGRNKINGSAGIEGPVVIGDPSTWSNIRIATKYPNISKKFFASKSIQVETIKLNGAMNWLLLYQCVGELLI